MSPETLQLTAGEVAVFKLQLVAVSRVKLFTWPESEPGRYKVWAIQHCLYIWNLVHLYKSNHPHCQLPLSIRCLPPSPNRACDWTTLCLLAPPPPLNKETNRRMKQIITCIFPPDCSLMSHEHDWSDFIKWQLKLNTPPPDYQPITAESVRWQVNLWSNTSVSLSHKRRIFFFYLQVSGTDISRTLLA